MKHLASPDQGKKSASLPTPYLSSLPIHSLPPPLPQMISSIRNEVQHLQSKISGKCMQPGQMRKKRLRLGSLWAPQQNPKTTQVVERMAQMQTEAISHYLLNN